MQQWLRNLEPAVDPTDIDATQWPWRKRYRVWQANREVFLWPENWMDESLRDDQSPFFKTTLSSLLQNDITDDSAAGAYLDYLSNLDQVAKLEPCGLYVQADTDGSAGDIVHVVARSAGAHRKHYYRRYQGGAWTPWTDTKLTIEDHPVVPLVWNGRLLLLWTQVHRGSTVDVSNPNSYLPQSVTGEQGLADTKLSDITGRMGSSAQQATKERISVVLCFSEFYNGAWQPVRTSDLNAPVEFTQATTGTFQHTSIDLRVWHSFDTTDHSLYVRIADRSTIAVPPLFGTAFTPGYVVHNTHSAPVPFASLGSAVALVAPTKSRMLPPQDGTGSPTALTAAYGTREASSFYGFPYYPTEASVAVVTGQFPQEIRQAQPDVDNQWSMPFFASDARNAFYVTTSASLGWFATYPGYGVVGPGTRWTGESPDIPVVIVNPPVPDPLGPVQITGKLGDPVYAQGALAEATTMRAVLATGTTFSLDGTAIGATGALPAQPGTERIGGAAPQQQEAQR